MLLFGGPAHLPTRLGSGPYRAVVVHGFPGTPAEVRFVAARLARAAAC